MRISFILTSAHGTGGTIAATIQNANLLVAHHKVEIICLRRGEGELSFRLDPRVSLHCLDDPQYHKGWRGLVKGWLARMPSRFSSPDDAQFRQYSALTDLQLLRYLRSRRSGAVIGTRSSLNLIVARFAPRRLLRLGMEHTNLARHSTPLQLAMREHYKGLSALLVLTDGDCGAYEALGIRTRIIVLPNAVRPLKARADPGAHTIVAVGRLVRIKGVDMLIDAFGQLSEGFPDWNLDIYGRGVLRPVLQTQIDDAGLGERIVLRGFRKNMRRVYSSASIFALSSRSEGHSLVLLEAMSAQLAPVAFDCPTGPREIITDPALGMLVPANDTNALASALAHLMRDEGARTRMGCAAAVEAQRYRPAVIMKQWQAILTGNRL